MPPKGRAAPPPRASTVASKLGAKKGGKPPSARPLSSPSGASSKPPGGRSSPAPSSGRGAAPGSGGGAVAPSSAGAAAPSKPGLGRQSTGKAARFDAAVSAKPHPAKLKRGATQELSSEAKAALNKSTRNLDIASLKATEPPQGVLVAVRVRPMGTVSREDGQECVVEMDGNTTRVRNPNNADDKPHDYAYDHSYWSFDGFKTLEDGTKAPDGPSYAPRQLEPPSRRAIGDVSRVTLTCFAPLVVQVHLRLPGEGVGRHRHGGARQFAQRLRRDGDGIRTDGSRKDVLGARPPA